MNKEEDFTDYDTENDKANSDFGSDSDVKTTTKDIAPPIVADELLRTKRARNVKLFSEDLLASSDGIHRIYNEFPQTCKYEGRGSEAAYLRRILTRYKEWAFQLHPGVAFEDVVLKCETLGSKGKIRTCLSDLRNTERDRFLTASIPDWNKKRKRPEEQDDHTPTHNKSPKQDIEEEELEEAPKPTDFDDDDLWQDIPESLQKILDGELPPAIITAESLSP